MHVRERIKAAVMLDRLQKHVMGEIEMTSTQVRSAEILLRKILPDLSAVEHSGEVETRYVAELPAVCEDGDEWERQYAPKRH